MVLVFIAGFLLFIGSSSQLFCSNEPSVRDCRTIVRLEGQRSTFLKQGDHIIAEFVGCRNVENFDSLKQVMCQAAHAAKATVVGFEKHKFEPQGMSGIVILQESHISVHTWPEYGYVAIDVFTCGQHVHIDEALKVLEVFFQPQEKDVIRIARGFNKDT